MATVTVEIQAAKEAYELGQAINGLVGSIKAQIDGDGFDAQDLPIIILENLQSITDAIDGIDQLDDELKEDVPSFINAWVVTSSQLAQQLLGNQGGDHNEGDPDEVKEDMGGG